MLLLTKLINKYKENTRFLPSIFLSIILYSLISQAYITNNLKNIADNSLKINNTLKINRTLILNQQQFLKKVLKNNIITIESNARYKLGFIKNGEKYYNFPK